MSTSARTQQSAYKILSLCRWALAIILLSVCGIRIVIITLGEINWIKFVLFKESIGRCHGSYSAKLTHTHIQTNESIKSTTAPLHSRNNYHSHTSSYGPCRLFGDNNMSTHSTHFAGDVISCDTFRKMPTFTCRMVEHMRPASQMNDWFLRARARVRTLSHSIGILCKLRIQN